jgi:hypothetical protein
MQVFSIEGRQIGKTESLVKGRNTFEMKYPAGIYIVRINDTEGVNIYKVYIN